MSSESLRVRRFYGERVGKFYLRSQVTLNFELIHHLLINL